jgi:hypothetical protein
MKYALLLVAACGPHASSPKLDGAPRPDSPAGDAAMRDAPQPYRHTIQIDGVDDFTADIYARYKCDGTFTTLERYDTASSTSWSTYAPAPMTGQGGNYLEMAISLSQLGAGTQLGVVTWMINENNGVESSYAGLYMDNFIDGYAADLQLTKYLPVDFRSTTPP